MNHLQNYFHSPYGAFAILTFAGVAAGQALLAIWAATGHGHWWLRALALWAGVLLLIPIRAYEPAAIFAIASPLTFILLVASRSIPCVWLCYFASSRQSTVPGVPGSSTVPPAPAHRLSLPNLYTIAALIILTIAALDTIYP